MEIWKDIKGYEGKYQVSSEGRIWSVGRQKVLKPQTGRHGYKHVSLIAKNGKKITELIHRLVALTFIPNEDNLPQVDHINEDKSDNRVCNLRWATAKDNSIHSNGKAVLCIETNKSYITLKEAERDTGIPSQRISECCNGKRIQFNGTHWKFI